MTPSQYAKVREIFLRAADLPPDSRVGFVEGELPDEPQLRDEVRSLLSHYDQSSRLLRIEAPAQPAPPQAPQPAARPPDPGTRVLGAHAEASPRPASAPRDTPGSRSLPGVGSKLVDHGRFTPGTLLAERFRIVALLGEGGMGEVYRADDLKLGQPVALKFLSQEQAADPLKLRDLHEEVRIARQISHPNVCRVYDIEEVDSSHFIVMEYVDGENLDQLLRRIGRLPEDKAVQIARQLCAGLSAIHDQGLLHRDLKPSNILIDSRGQAKIADFGLAAIDLELHKATAAGTPGYMAPETLRGEPVTVQSELYALGLVLYEMFTGRRAFVGEGAAELMRQQREGDPPAPSTIRAAINPIVERVILRCLDRNPEHRPKSARLVAAALPGGDPLGAAIAAGETPSPELIAAAGTHSGISRRLGLILMACAVGGLLAVTLLSRYAFLVPRAALEKPPEVLTDRARDLARRAGYDLTGFAQASGFVFDDAGLRTPETPERATRRWEALRRGRHSVIRFWFRASPRPMVPLDLLEPRGPDDPPPDKPGMITVLLDGKGRLIEFSAIPRSGPANTTADNAATWSSMFSAAGLDPANYASAPPTILPAMYADRLRAWTPLPGADQDVSAIEGASYQGKPVHFHVHTPWDTDGGIHGDDSSQFSRTTLGRSIDLALVLVMLVAGSVLAWQNLRSGKGDHRGAWRLAAFVFGARVAWWLISAAYFGDLQALIKSLTANLGVSLYQAAVAWLFYIAIEPYVRRVWPQTVISWSRLLAGQLTDPLVGRDILIGVGVGAAAAIFAQLECVIPGWLGLDPVRPVIPSGTLANLAGTRLAFGQMFIQLRIAIYMGLAALLLVVVFRVLTRSRWLSVLLAAGIYTAIFALQGAHPYLSWLIWGVLWIAVTTALVRVGLVAWISACFVAYVLTSYPITSDFTAWYAGQSNFALAVILLMALYGLIAALGGKSLLPKPAVA